MLVKSSGYLCCHNYLYQECIYIARGDSRPGDGRTVFQTVLTAIASSTRTQLVEKSSFPTIMTTISANRPPNTVRDFTVITDDRISEKMQKKCIN
jgi:hypothetical protein